MPERPYEIDSDGDFVFPSGEYLWRGAFRPEDIVGEVVPRQILVRTEGGWGLASDSRVHFEWSRTMIPDPDDGSKDAEVTAAWHEFEECYEELIRVLRFGAQEGNYFYEQCLKAGYPGAPMLEAWLADRMGRMIAEWEGKDA